MPKALKAPKRVIDELKKAERIAVMSHMAPDGDALGSILALTRALRSMGKQAVGLSNDPLPSLYDFFPGQDMLLYPGDALPFTPDLCVAVDISDAPRLGHWGELFEACPRTLCIDHHATKKPIGDVHWVNSDVAAACEMVYATVRGLGVALDYDIAVYVYTGICTDTGNFNYGNTTGSVLRLAASLVDAGIDVAEITRVLYRVRSYPQVKILGKAIDSLRLDRGIATMLLTKRDFAECGAVDADAEGVVNYAIETQDAIVAILVKEQENASKISMRSVKNVNVADIAVQLGGGGHEKASGVIMRESAKVTLQKAVEAVRAEMDRLGLE